MSYTVEGYWDCPACGAKAIRSRYRECPSCGKPRGEETHFYTIEEDESNATNNALNSPDWLCEFCGSYNPDAVAHCLSCGADKTNHTYHEVNRRKANTHSSIVSHVRSVNEETSTRKWKYAGILASAFALIVIVWLLMPTTKEITVRHKLWQSEVAIEQLCTIEENAWSVPSGGRVKYTSWEIRTYNRVVDHYKTVYEEVSERVQDGYEIKKHKVDKGNGYFEITEEKVPKYKIVRRQVEKQEPVYKKVPVYDTRYFYEIERWKSTRTVKENGSDSEPYFGEVVLAKATNRYNAGMEREKSRHIIYNVEVVIGGETKTFKVSKEVWDILQVGQKRKVNIGFDNELSL